MLRLRPDRPLEPEQLEALRAVDEATTALGLSYFVAGAMARDILLTHVFGLRLQRATRDLDFAVAVTDWDELDAIQTRLVEKAGFERERKMRHRVRRDDYPVDLLPFGGVESDAHTVAWPPDLANVMNVAGYDDALAASEQVHIEEGLEVPVVSLPGLAMLKLFAWDDRGHDNAKDALDFMTLLESYSAAGTEDRLYGEALDTMEAADYDLRRAGARLLGRDAARMMSTETRARLAELLADATKRDRLTLHMARAHDSSEDAVEGAERLLAEFEAGLHGEPRSP